jgi:hypothetical protein
MPKRRIFCSRLIPPTSASLIFFFDSIYIEHVVRCSVRACLFGLPRSFWTSKQKKTPRSQSPEASQSELLSFCLGEFFLFLEGPKAKTNRT